MNPGNDNDNEITLQIDWFTEITTGMVYTM